MMNSDNPAGIEDFSNDITESDAEALGALFIDDDEPADDAAKDQPIDEHVEEETEDKADADEDAQADEDADETPEDEDTSEDADLAFATDDALVELEDGTRVTVKDLRAGNLRDADYRKKTMALADERRTIEETVTQSQQLQQQAAQEREWMANALRAVIPAKPDPSMMESDPIGYMQAKEKFDQFQGQFQQLERQKQQADHSAQQKQQQETQQRLEREKEAMIQANPEFRDRAKLDQFWQEASTSFTDSYGFTADEVASLADHRFVKVIRNAMAYDKLMADKPKVKKSLEGKPPVLKSDPRQGRKSRASKAVNDRIAKAAQSGNVESVSDILGQLFTGE